MNKIELNSPQHAYFYGFIQADGHLSEATRNRGALSIELSSKDENILKTFSNVIPYVSYITRRTRSTNFKDDYESVCLRFHSLDFRNKLKSFGMRSGNKSPYISEPIVSFSQRDFWRGIIDGDGSLGITSNNRPFISLVTTSESLFEQFVDLIYQETGKRKVLKRNVRDNVYNIMVCDEDAQSLTNFLYYENCLCLDRKLEQADRIRNWVRPTNLKKISFIRQFWNKEEDSILLNNSIDESCKILSRSKSSVKTRLWRLSKR